MFDSFGDDDDVAVDMAPLIDCVFLLLIFFLVATTMKQQVQELDLDLPSGVRMAQQAAVDEDIFVLSIDRIGQLHLGATPATTDTVLRAVREKAAANPKQRVRIDFDKLTPGQAIVQAVDLVKFAGLDNIGIHIDNEKQ